MANMDRDYFTDPANGLGDDDFDDPEPTPAERIREAVDGSRDWADGVRLIRDAVYAMDPVPRAKVELVFAFLLAGRGGPCFAVR